MGTLPDRGSVSDALAELAALVPWGAAQQWVLQTVVLREARRRVPPGASTYVSALLFAMVHLPNPLLTLMTFAGAVGWCTIFQRHPNILPLAVSHAVGTLALLYSFDDDTLGQLRIGHAYLRLDD